MTASLWFLTGLASGLLLAHHRAVLVGLVAAVDWLTTDPVPPPRPEVGARNVRVVREGEGG